MQYRKATGPFGDVTDPSASDASRNSSAINLVLAQLLPRSVTPARPTDTIMVSRRWDRLWSAPILTTPCIRCKS